MNTVQGHIKKDTRSERYFEDVLEGLVEIGRLEELDLEEEMLVNARRHVRRINAANDLALERHLEVFVEE